MHRRLKLRVWVWSRRRLFGKYGLLRRSALYVRQTSGRPQSSIGTPYQVQPRPFKFVALIIPHIPLIIINENRAHYLHFAYPLTNCAPTLSLASRRNKAQRAYVSTGAVGSSQIDLKDNRTSCSTAIQATACRLTTI